MHFHQTRSISSDVPGIAWMARLSLFRYFRLRLLRFHNSPNFEYNSENIELIVYF